MENLIFLDTHVVVWLYSARTDLLSEKAKSEIENNSVLIAPMVQLELQYLRETDRIVEASVNIISRLTLKIGLQVCRKEFPPIVAKALEFNWTRDPFDRIITAQAAINNTTLLTKDSSILSHYRFAVWDG
jgi:PIN domain nuclease of toxin-antitoxin system